MVNFNTEVAGVLFEFKTMNVKKLQLFQVYVQHDGQKVRFHMQRKGNGDFYITDRDKVPQAYKDMEQQLNAAIFDNHPGEE